MRFALGQVVGVDVDDVAADGLRRRQRQGEVLMLCVQGQVLLVDGALVDCVRTRVIYDFTEKNYRHYYKVSLFSNGKINIFFEVVGD